MNHRFIELKKQIGKFIANFSITEENGKEYIFDGETIREGLEVSTYNENGEIEPLADGTYTIKGVEVEITDGIISKLLDKESKIEAPKEEEKEPATEPTEMANEEEPKEDEQSIMLAKLLAENEALKAENDSLKAELKAIKETPMANPVPQRTDMSSDKVEPSPDVKGTKYERAFNILNS